ncbi:hypothetical protein EYF80_045254 [Liparis tanakae]|uniref:Uncharacterized protein n=1 Tax=Liparis tanakae TaxID=230148 RepID=A0A4Z2FU37_9TELE|nr:hypothetical protein EYF80_045254 [Liparis tanakae]
MSPSMHRGDRSAVRCCRYLNIPQHAPRRQRVVTPEPCGSPEVVTSGQLGDRDAASDPQRVDGAERRQPVLEVEQLLSVHDDAEPTGFTVDLHLGERDVTALRRTWRSSNRTQSSRATSGGGSSDPGPHVRAMKNLNETTEF